MNRTIHISDKALISLSVAAESYLRLRPVCYCRVQQMVCFPCDLANALKEVGEVSPFKTEVPELKPYIDVTA